MLFELGFSDEFFNVNRDDLDKSDRPTSVWQALISMSDDDWKEMCKAVFPGRTSWSNRRTCPVRERRVAHHQVGQELYVGELG